MIGFPFDSHVTYDSEGVPSYDRAISSEPYRKLLKELFSTGILPNPSSNLQVTAGSDMTVIVTAGFAIIEGCMKLEETNKTLAITASDQTYDRIDTVVLRLDTNDNARECELYVVAGTPATSPIHPALTRSNSVYEIGLADILIPSNSTQIADARITDTRYNSERCGVISSISEFDTTTIYDQIKADMAEFKTVEQADFETWLDGLKDALSGDVAGNLQNEINTLGNRVNGHDGNISTIEGEISDIEGDISDLQTESAKIANKADMADVYGASAYASGTAYAVGDIVTYDGKAWKCLVACTGQTPAEGTYWTRVSLKTSQNGIDALNLGLAHISVYVGDDKKLHFVDRNGADSALPFSSGADLSKYTISVSLLHTMTYNQGSSITLPTFGYDTVTIKITPNDANVQVSRDSTVYGNYTSTTTLNLPITGYSSVTVNNTSVVSGSGNSSATITFVFTKS